MIDSNYIRIFTHKPRNPELDVVYGYKKELFLESISNLIIKTDSEQF